MENQLIRIPGVDVLPPGLQIQKVDVKYVKALRQDGMRIFFDRREDALSMRLNQVRAWGDKQTIVMAVGLVRGLQIARSYADHYDVDLPKTLEVNILTQLNRLLPD